MASKEQIKKEVERLIANFPSYDPVLEGEINIVSELMEKLGGVSDEDLHKALYNLTVVPGNKFAPSTSEIIHAINELKYEGMSNTDRMVFDMGIRPASETIAELGLDKTISEEQRIKNVEMMRKAREERGLA